MKREYNIKDILSGLSYKGLPFPGLWFGLEKKAGYSAKDFELDADANENEQKTQSDLGAILRKKDALGRWYFLPVILEHEGKEYEIPNAVIRISGKKKIVETDMIGRKGSVKELISIDDYEITVSGIIVADDFPEEGIMEINELYNINESVKLKCALTDIFMETDDKVVIKDIDFQEMKGTEHVQLFSMNMVTDRNFELIIE